MNDHNLGQNRRKIIGPFSCKIKDGDCAFWRSRGFFAPDFALTGPGFPRFILSKDSTRVFIMC